MWLGGSDCGVGVPVYVCPGWCPEGEKLAYPCGVVYAICGEGWFTTLCVDWWLLDQYVYRAVSDLCCDWLWFSC